MKPVRGSSRASSKQPNFKEKKKPRRKTAKSQESDPRANNGSGNSHPKPPQKRNAKVAVASVPRKVRGQETWKPMTRSSITAVENILDLSILSTLSFKRTEKEETQKHLNILKKRFLAQCAQLKVPIQRQRDFEQSSRQHREETNKSLVGKKTLSSLEEDLRAVVSTLEKTEEQTASLDCRCSKLREQLEEEEEKAKEILQMSEQGVLSLPALPLRNNNEATLQHRMTRMVPNAESEATVCRLGKVLQNSAPIKDAQMLLVRAHKYVDQLPSPHLALIDDQ
ncbi:centromere protein Q isoform 2-T2 [Polymixia lowei]